MFNYSNNSALKAYQKPWSELLEANPEGLLCVSGDGDIKPVEYEEWGSF